MEQQKSETKLTEIPADQALFNGLFSALIVTFYQNERPPSGLMGQMDWHFQGFISRSIKMGAITGRTGELVYYPVQKSDRLYHLVLVGAGPSDVSEQRPPLPASCFAELRKNLLSLKISKFGLSRADFGNVEPESISKHLKGVSLWITP